LGLILLGCIVGEGSLLGDAGEMMKLKGMISNKPVLREER
jgi:hypothetical protein